MRKSQTKIAADRDLSPVVVAARGNIIANTLLAAGAAWPVFALSAHVPAPGRTRALARGDTGSRYDDRLEQDADVRQTKTQA